MSRILEIAIRNHKENLLEEDFQPDMILSRRQSSRPPSDFSEVPVEPHREDWQPGSDNFKNFLTREYRFSHFKHMLYFINESIRKSEELQHHPVLVVENNIITVQLYTHDVNDVTSLDKDLASYMDEIYQDIVYISEL